MTYSFQMIHSRTYSWRTWRELSILITISIEYHLKIVEETKNPTEELTNLFLHKRLLMMQQRRVKLNRTNSFLNDHSKDQLPVWRDWFPDVGISVHWQMLLAVSHIWKTFFFIWWLGEVYQNGRSTAMTKAIVERIRIWCPCRNNDMVFFLLLLWSSQLEMNFSNVNLLSNNVVFNVTKQKHHSRSFPLSLSCVI